MTVSIEKNSTENRLDGEIDLHNGGNTVRIGRSDRCSLLTAAKGLPSNPQSSSCPELWLYCWDHVSARSRRRRSNDPLLHHPHTAAA